MNQQDDSLGLVNVSILYIILPGFGNLAGFLIWFLSLDLMYIGFFLGTR